MFEILSVHIISFCGLLEKKTDPNQSRICLFSRTLSLFATSFVFHLFPAALFRV
jgi:hypothetical protein